MSRNGRPVVDNGVDIATASATDRGLSSGVAGVSAAARHADGLALPVPPEWLDALAGLVAERLRLLGEPVSPWMTRAQAADYLSVSLARLEKDRTVPAHRWEGRVLYHRGELDEWLLGMGAR
jgi:hypothetical protein